jgi:hypothetical protein
LIVPLVAYTFWILLGVAAASGSSAPRPSTDVGHRTRRVHLGQIVAAVFVAIVLGSVPFRIRQAIEQVDFARVTYGFADWETEGDGTAYRWTGGRATFFVPASVRAVEVPLRAFPPGELGLEAFEIRILVDHRLANRVRLGDDAWHVVRVPAPRPERRGRYWRVDLVVSPTWRPAETIPGSADWRWLGVKVGEIAWVRP